MQSVAQERDLRSVVFLFKGLLSYAQFQDKAADVLMSAMAAKADICRIGKMVGHIIAAGNVYAGFKDQS